MHSPEPGSETHTAHGTGKAWPQSCRGQKEFHFGSTWLCVRKERRLTPDVWGRETLLLRSPFSCILSLSSNVSCLLSAGHSFRGDGVRKRWPPEFLHPAQRLGLQLPPGEPNTSEEHPRAWGAMECGAPARQHFLRCLICVPQPFPGREGGRPRSSWGCSSLVPVICTDF